MFRYSLREFILFVALFSVLVAWCADRWYLVSKGNAEHRRVIEIAEHITAKTGWQGFWIPKHW